MPNLTGKAAVITGAAAGIGRACAERLARDGMSVLIADIADQRGEATAAELRERGHRAVYQRYDAASPDDAEAVVRRAIAEFGRCDVGIASAGIIGRASNEPARPVTDHPDFLRFDETDWNAVWSINVTGALRFIQACGRAFLDLGCPGSIVAITSVAAANPTLASNPSYAVSKAALTSLVRNLSPKLAPLGIRLNAVGPGTTETSMSAGLLEDPERMAAVLALVPMGRLGQPTEIADAVAFLAGDESGFVTGESLYVDGGFFTG